MLVYDIVRIRCQEMTSEDTDDFMWLQLQCSLECVNQGGCYSYL
jgi:hypothetical protein